MNFLTDNTKTLYRKFLFASIGSAMATSIYNFVDAIAIGQSEGAIGTAAMAVISPFYAIIPFLAMICGVGGAVLMSNARGQKNDRKSNEWFSLSTIIISVLTLIIWLTLALFRNPILIFFGANEEILPKTMEYAIWIIMFLPVFIIPFFFSIFVRNDGNPKLPFIAVLVGGSVNVFGDWFLVFPMGMKMKGAAIATVLGMLVQSIIIFSHFFSSKCGLKFVKPKYLMRRGSRILKLGISSGVLEIGAIIIGILMNNQIIKYGTTNHLAVYGVVATIVALFQALFAGVGQAIQPLVSTNYGAKNMKRVKEFWNMSFATVIIISLMFIALGEFLPIQITKLFIKATAEVLAVAPTIFRIVFLLFAFLGISVLSIYYLQSVFQGRKGIFVAILKSIVANSFTIIVLPVILGLNGVWLALPAAEGIVAVFALYFVRKVNQKL